MRTDVTWDKGGSAEVLSAKGDWLVVISEVPCAPGTPWRGALASGAFIGLKVKTCKRQEGGRFVIDGPAFNLTKEAREEIAGILASVPDGSAPAEP